MDPGLEFFDTESQSDLNIVRRVVYRGDRSDCRLDYTDDMGCCDFSEEVVPPMISFHWELAIHLQFLRLPYEKPLRPCLDCYLGESR
jgi:hypothetical protein